MFKEIRNTDGRYIINEEGMILDKRPYYIQYPDWQWMNIDPTQPREIMADKNGLVMLEYANGTRKTRMLHLILKETFPELYTLSEEKLNDYKKRINDPNQATVTFQVEDINKLLFPNKILFIYDRTFNDEKHINPNDKRKYLWKKPTKVTIKPNGTITLKRGHSYFGVGTLNLIKFNNLLPSNGKPFAEKPNKIHYQIINKNMVRTQKKHIHTIWEDN